MLLACGTLALAAGVSLLLLHRMSEVASFYDALLANEVTQLKRAREMQVTFKKQVQAWKDILLRGENREDRAKYGLDFSKQDSAVNRLTEELQSSITEPEAEREIQSFSAAHLELDRRYQEGLAVYDSATGKAFEVDRMLRGRDRAPTDLVDKIVQELSAEIDRKSAAFRESIAIRRREMLSLLAFLLAAISLLTVLFARSTSRRLGDILPVLSRFAKGDLKPRLAEDATDEIGEIGKHLNRFVQTLEENLREVSFGTARLASASEEISASAREQSNGAEMQRDQTRHVATAMQQMSATVGQISESSTKAAAAARQSAETARDGGKVVEETLQKMRQIAESVAAASQRVTGLGKRSEQIGQIVAVIDEIAEQTNLLALNAAIEAARAGDQGRGFAVVADEVRKLAERTSTATREIAEMIGSIQGETTSAVQAMESGVRLVKAGSETTTLAGASLQEIIGAGNHVGEMVNQIAAASTEQSAAAQEINASVEQIARITSEMANGSRQSATACEELSSLALNLEALVRRYRLSTESEETQRDDLEMPPPLTRRPRPFPPPARIRRHSKHASAAEVA
jgi:methyl-accepting chemotaxis protein